MTLVLRVALAIRQGHAHSPLTGVSTKCFQRCVSLLMSRKRRKAPQCGPLSRLLSGVAEKEEQGSCSPPKFIV